MEGSELNKKIKHLSKYRLQGRYPEALIQDYQKDISYTLPILSAWWGSNGLTDLTAADILRHVKKINPKEKSSTINEKIKRLVADGTLEKTKYGRYKRTHLTATDKEAPAFFIKNGDFSAFFSLPLNSYEYLHYYGFKIKDKNNNYILPLEDIILEYKELGNAISEAVKNFSKNTGEIPRIVTYTNFGEPQPLSYILGQLRFEIYSLIHQHKNLNQKKINFLKNGLIEDIKNIQQEIYREAILDWYDRQRSTLIKCYKEVIKLNKNQEEINKYFLHINKEFKLISENKRRYHSKEILESIKNKIKNIDKDISFLQKADVYILGLVLRSIIIPDKELDRLIKKKAKRVYKKFVTKG